jgi:hypothetical protein
MKTCRVDHRIDQNRGQHGECGTRRKRLGCTEPALGEKTTAWQTTGYFRKIYGYNRIVSNHLQGYSSAQNVAGLQL